jgi:hypothetical protein
LPNSKLKLRDLQSYLEFEPRFSQLITNWSSYGDDLYDKQTEKCNDKTKGKCKQIAKDQLMQLSVDPEFA